jgi:Spx/MgsR family transcriptional regulator
MTPTLYGIPNCDTVKRARAWLTERGVAHTFHDFKRQGVPADALTRWLEALGHERLLNRQGTTWRKLDDETKARAADPAGAQDLMLAQPSVIRRPVVAWPDGEVTAGFDAEGWARRVA